MKIERIKAKIRDFDDYSDDDKEVVADVIRDLQEATPEAEVGNALLEVARMARLNERRRARGLVRIDDE